MNNQETQGTTDDVDPAPVDRVVMPCDCATWGRDNLSAILHLEHHPRCERYRPEPEIRELLQRLIDGIESWASDEDGVHPDCWDAYVNACSACGQWNRPGKPASNAAWVHRLVIR